MLNVFPEDTPFQKSYDFIIVGAGTAGCVLANRLSEVPHWNILLIEAGKAEDVIVKIPLLTGYLQQTNYSTIYVAEKDKKFCFGLYHYIILTSTF